MPCGAFFVFLLLTIRTDGIIIKLYQMKQKRGRNEQVDFEKAFKSQAV